MRSLEDRIDLLIGRLGDDDARSVRSAGDQLLEIGSATGPGLMEALARGEVEVRKAASYLLGRLAARTISGAREERQHQQERAALLGALGDDEPKVRKNAAVALGKVVTEDDEDAETTVSGLAAALNTESISWVRPSLILALGAVGGDAARRALGALDADTAAEAAALRKALDRVRTAAPEIAWRAGVPTPAPVWAGVPPGLEDVARQEAEETLLRVGLEADTDSLAGRIRLSAAAPRAQVLSRLRCAHDLRLLLAEAPPLNAADGELGGFDSVPEQVAELLAGAPILDAWKNYFESDEEILHYRFALEDMRLPKAIFFRLLAAVRDTLEPRGLVDSPSNYSLQLTVEAGRRATRVWLIPTFLEDRRFAYRRQDVGASLHPVVAAGLARLLRGNAEAEEAPRRRSPRVVFDPTCGSATLLIERAILEERIEARAARRRGEDVDGSKEGLSRHLAHLRLRGIDASPTAVRAAQANLRAAGLVQEINVDRADAGDRRSWSAVDEVVANLPFGRRSRRQDQDLENLYQNLARHLARSLRPGGRALLYTSERELLEKALARHAGELRWVERRSVEAGGIRVTVWLLTR